MTKTEFDFSSIGGRIKIAIECRGITQKKLSESIGISEEALVNYLRNRRNPPIQTIVDIADNCFVEAGWLLNASINVSVVDVLLKCLKEICNVPMSEIVSIMSVSEEYFNILGIYELEPSFSFATKLIKSFIVVETKANEFLTSIAKSKKVSSLQKAKTYHQIEVTEKQGIKLKEIINLISDDSDAQQMVLDLARSLKKRKSK